MAYDSPKGIVLTALKCGAVTLIAKQHKFVKLDGAGDVVFSDGTQGENCIGILQNKPAIGQACEIIAVGVSKLVTDASAAFAEGSKITSDGVDGLGDQAASGDHVLAIALTTPGTNAGELFTVLVNCAGAPVLA